MDLKDILSDIQRSIDDLQLKLNLLRSIETGTLYDVDVLMTRKEAAYFLGKSLRQIDRLCSEGRLRRCYTDRGGVRIRKSDLLEFQGLELTPMTSAKGTESMSEFERIIQKYKVK
jgi:excisionase family DNA binding protein